MTTQAEIVAGTQNYLIENYGRLPMAMVRGEGSRIWDGDGGEYLDFFAGFGMCGVAGHCHPAIVEAVTEQVRTLIACGNIFTNAPQVELAKAITEHAFGGKVFFCHSGAEANEAALKIVRLAAGPGRYKIISFSGCFHGRTMGALSLTPQKFQKGLEPMLDGNVMVEFGDLDAVAAAVDEATAGIFVEPIQGEGGVNVPTKEFMQGLRDLCDRENLLLVCDEVWTAPARTGKWFAYQHYDIAPDVMTLAKAIGGGLPVGVCVAAPKCQDVLVPGTHGCTGGGNPLCAAAGAAAVKLIEQENLVERAGAKGDEIARAIRDAEISRVVDVRGSGLMIGIELDSPGKDVMKACMDRGLLINCTAEKVIRIAPALTTSDELLAQGTEMLIEVLRG